MIWPRLARTLAIAIALAGVIDPVVVANRDVRPTVSVESTGESPAAALAADRIARALSARFVVVRRASIDASATIAVGDRVPDGTAGPTPFFAVIPDTSPRVHIDTLVAPRRAALESLVPVGVEIAVDGGRGRALTIELEQDGVTVDRVRRTVSDEPQRLAEHLSFVPAREGATALHVTATVEGARAAVADAALDVVGTPWRVFFYDRRPSWLSTFVRRVLERDARFDVSGRTLTSTGVSSADASAPASLLDRTALDRRDAVVVGSPSTVTAQDVASLETFARRRSGTVVLLMDQADLGPFSGTLGTGRLESVRLAEPAPIDLAPPFDGTLEASELAWPVALPPGATVLATTAPARPIIFSVPVGAGRFIVSGALDAWRYRGSSATSPFEQFWRVAIGGAAASALPPVAIELSPTVVEPGATVDVAATLRDVWLDGAARPHSATVAAAVTPVSGGGSQSVRLWPDGAPGRFHGAIAAPRTAGRYNVAVSSGDRRATASFVVARGARTAGPDERGLLEAWATSHGGRAFRGVDPTAVMQAVSTAVQPERRPTPVHPMRSPWWILPFALALGGEWWWRRRHDRR